VQGIHKHAALSPNFVFATHVLAVDFWPIVQPETVRFKRC
jgi:hypothetical protein